MIPMCRYVSNSGSNPRNACRLRKKAMRDFQESVTDEQTDGQADDGQSDPYVQLYMLRRRHKKKANGMHRTGN